MTLRIGLQLYSVRNALADSIPATLQRISDLGFRYLEAANHHAATDDGIGFGTPAAELRTMLDDLGLQVIGCHVNPLDRQDRLPAVLDYQQEIGNDQIGCDIEFYPPGDLDYVLRRAEFFNQVGQLCADREMRFYYHNHYQEFQRVGGRPVYELILDNTDPKLVFVEMDTYWMYRGGQDPVAWMSRYPDRVVLLHQKDFPTQAAQPLNLYEGVVDIESTITMETFERDLDPATFTEIGTGTLPIQEIIDTASNCRTCSTCCWNRTSALTRIWSRLPSAARPSATTAASAGADGKGEQLTTAVAPSDVLDRQFRQPNCGS